MIGKMKMILISTCGEPVAEAIDPSLLCDTCALCIFSISSVISLVYFNLNFSI